MALAAAKKRARFAGNTIFHLGVTAAVVCYQGGLAILAGAYLRPARAGQGGDDAAKAANAATYRAIGVFTETVTGGAGDGDVVTRVEAGVWCFANSAGANAITRADIGKAAYVVDDDTVARLSANSTRPLAGVIREVDADGVWVDVGVAPPARRIITVPFAINETDTLAPTNAEVIWPVSGEIVGMSVIVQKAVTTGGDVTLKNVTTDVVGLACTIADAATKGTIVSDTPTAGDATTYVAAGTRGQVCPAAAFATGGAVSGHVEIAY